ncbi:hypothetical protein [Sphingobacterium chuzhouense]|uniref:DoxX n=1 Tax=Sphingobacterium chuzhouense TaxID=1742264 RepID=A0ABR7XVP5_9SPHI|nr:hypothetical protein [Sphingobacterium chuzhouense]MBD1423132.1 hypothetical protein [Sphingobacterium chuzhouense]
MSNEKLNQQKDVRVNDQESGNSNSVTQQPKPWTLFQKIAFRIGFIYIVLLVFPTGIFSIPPNFSWFSQWFNYDWTNLHYRDLYSIARYSPSFPTVSRWLDLPRLEGHSIWLVLLVISTVLGLVWTLIDRKTKEYNKLYYWSLVFARFRAGIGIIGFGFTKVLPVQMPYPSEGLLNTDFGDFTGQKIYWLSIGIVPWYQVFTGIVELTAGTLLFFRQTTVYGAALLFTALGSITIVNHVYDGGVQGYAFYFVLLGLYIFGYYIPRIYQFFILQKYTVPVDYWPVFKKKWEKGIRIGLKTGVIALFLGVFFYLQLKNFLYDPYKQPSTPGVKELRGYYDVTTFKINGEEIPYNPLDTVRWQEATFEKWSTLTFKVNKPTRLDLSNGGGSPIRDIDRTFEIAGTGGGQRVFHYYVDTVDQRLYLQDKIRTGGVLERGEGEQQSPSGRRGEQRQQDNQDLAKENGSSATRDTLETRLAGNNRKNHGFRNRAESDPLGPNWISEVVKQRIGDENLFIDPRGATGRRTKEFARQERPSNRNKMILNYSTTDGNTIILSGINENRDSLYIVLNRVHRDYLLSRSTLDAGKYD